MKQNTVITALYLRLSRDDNSGKLVSMSIENQEKLLLNYIQEKQWQIYDIYIDDGYSGTNFERPAFKRMIKNAEDGKFNCVITKDLSRLGRNYIHTGLYTEEIFPELGIRFIAINDNVDTEEADNEIAAFHHVLNELYPKQVSKKVRQVKKASAAEGKFMGSQAPFGYMKSLENKHKLIPDESAVDLVHRLFKEYANGGNSRQIADKLNEEGIDSPRFYHYAKIGKTNPIAKEKNNWSSATILQLLRNQVYIGNMVQGKREVINFKSKKRRTIAPESWIVVEGTHEAIIEKDLWGRVQARLLSRHKSHKAREKSEGIFSGLLVCGDCGMSLSYTHKELKSCVKGIYRCCNYTMYGNNACTSHYIDEEYLSQIVLNDIKSYAQLTANEKEKLYERLLEFLNIRRDEETECIQVNLDKAKHRQQVILNNLKSMYEDKSSGLLPENIFHNLMEEFSSEQDSLSEEIKLAEDQIAQIKKAESDVSHWLKLVQSHTEIIELDRETCFELIDSITVKEVVYGKKKREQEILINYRFIGNIPILNKEKKDIA